MGVDGRRAIVAVQMRVAVADRMERARPERAVGTRPARRHARAPASIPAARSPRSARSPARSKCGGRSPGPRCVGAERAHPLHDEVETILFGRADVVVVHRGTQHFARAWTQRLEGQRFAAAGSVMVAGTPPLTTRTTTARGRRSQRIARPRTTACLAATARRTPAGNQQSWRVPPVD